MVESGRKLSLSIYANNQSSDQSVHLSAVVPLLFAFHIVQYIYKLYPKSHVHHNIGQISAQSMFSSSFVISEAISHKH